MRASDARAHLRKLADKKTAAVLSGFFKTGVGEYSEGDQFLGIRSAQMREAAKLFVDLPQSELDILLRSCIHEHRQLALKILGEQYRNGNTKQREAIHRFYLARTRHVNNWDLVDDSAPTLIGQHLFGGKTTVLEKLAKSKLWWERRISIVATQHFIRNKKFDTTLKLSKKLLKDDHDLMHKAVGWMLREVGKRDEKTLRNFLDQHAPQMPRTMLRYAIERFSPQDRKHYLNLPRRPAV